MAHLKLDFLLRQTEYKHFSSERLRIYLTNSLEEGKKTKLPFMGWLAEEVNEASNIKQEVPVMVVLGNPPYSGISQNKGEWILNKIEDYKYVDGVHFNERKHWLQDDYVKFIRYGQHFIEKNGEGIVAYINNHNFLDNPTFRGMRWHLIKTFDKIYIFDLHGNAKKKETALDGGKDENVFDIQQGVSINIFLKTRNNKGVNSLATVYYADLYGKRQDKYNFLLNTNLQSIQWKSIECKEPFFFFVPKSENNKNEYDSGFGINELFFVNVTGIVTARDSLVIDIEKETLLKRIQKFCDLSLNDDELRKWLFPNKENDKYHAGDTRGWKLSKARRKIKNNKHEDFIVDINYRPFDIRKIYYTPDMVDWGREKIMKHFTKGENVGIVICRQAATNSWELVNITKNIVDDSFVSNRTKERGYVFPLYVFLDGGIGYDSKRLPDIKTPNLNKTIIVEIAQHIGLQFSEVKDDTVNTFSPIDVLDYIYAVLHSPTYRDRFKEFLKVDFPRIPYPMNVEDFWRLVELGSELRQLHLMEFEDPLSMITAYPLYGIGNNNIDRVLWSIHGEKQTGQIWINETQYFGNIPIVVWNFYMGGYQPAQKWLKDRKGSKLTFSDIVHYQRIIVALKETNILMCKVDEIFTFIE